jgi:hypothetical protein
MEQINNSNSCCATCTYWMGYRNSNRLGFVEVSSCMAYGQCARHELSENYTRQANYSCSNYSKWGVLG